MEQVKIKMLLVDDDQSILDLYEKYLSNDIFEKRSADNGKDALSVFHSWHPDVIVLDIIMPVMTGYAVLDAIRTGGKDKTTKIIMATSMSDMQSVQKCAKYGIHGYIVKPFKSRDLGSKILHCIQPKHDPLNEAKLSVRIDKDLQDIAPKYLESRRADVATMLHALKDGRFETIRVLGHSMKGSGGGYGFDEITQLGEEIETAAQRQDLKQLKVKINELFQYIDHVEVVYE